MEQHSKDYACNPGSLSDAVNRMFSEGYNSNWGQFASTKWIAKGKGCPNTVYISLEYIHNNIHVRWQTSLVDLADLSART